MKDRSSWVTDFLVLILGLLLFVGWLAFSTVRSDSCEDEGGEYVWMAAQCVGED